MPYLGETSVQLEKELRNFFRKCLKELVHLSLIHKTHNSLQLGQIFVQTYTVVKFFVQLEQILAWVSEGGKWGQIAPWSLTFDILLSIFL